MRFSPRGVRSSKEMSSNLKTEWCSVGVNRVARGPQASPLEAPPPRSPPSRGPPSLWGLSPHPQLAIRPRGGAQSRCPFHGRQGYQGRLAFGQEEKGGRGRTHCAQPQQDTLLARCVLRPDTWSLHTGPCPACLSSPCLGPNLCQARLTRGQV